MGINGVHSRAEHVRGAMPVWPERHGVWVEMRRYAVWPERNMAWMGGYFVWGLAFVNNLGR